MQKPTMILNPHFRKMDELFSDETREELFGLCEIIGGTDAPLSDATINAHLAKASFLVAARPIIDEEMLRKAPQLRSVIEVSGAFHEEIDYRACHSHGVEVLSCAPGFRQSVAEMGLAMMLAAGRGLVAEHEAFRSGRENWLDDRSSTDFSLFRQSVGFVGYGNIARELHRLIEPFQPSVAAYDPWLSRFPDGVTAMSLKNLFETCRIVVVTAVPSEDNAGLIDTDAINSMSRGSALILLSRAHVIDFAAALSAARTGKITLATDVYPSEPVPQGDAMRSNPGVIHSPHRAAAVPGGRQLIGDMILHDVKSILNGRSERHLLKADVDRVSELVEAQRKIEAMGKLPNT